MQVDIVLSTRLAPKPEIAADPKFKKYTQAVEKCLATFDNVHEWADFISFLGKLLKVGLGWMDRSQTTKSGADVALV
jgi:Dopey, N-terminal